MMKYTVDMKTKQNKPKLGRPPKPKALKQSESVQVVLTPSERRELAKQAKAAGLTAAGYLRNLFLKQRGC